MKHRVVLSAVTAIAIGSGVAYSLLSSDNTIFKHKAYIGNYVEKHELSSWITYSITNKQRLNKVVPRYTSFKNDEAIKTGSSSVKDYVGSGYDRGHLAPANIFRYDADAEKESFRMSNIIPQPPAVNRGAWKHIEEYVESLTLYYKKIYVITGCVVFAHPYRIGQNKVAVPDLMYKIVYDKNKQFIVAFLVPNEERNDFRLDDFKTSLQLVKVMSNIKDFHSIVELNK